MQHTIAQGHLPVLSKEMVTLLRPEPGGLYIDCTIGPGGHAELILEAAQASHLIGIDCDAQALELARRRLHVYRGRVTFLHRRYQELEHILAELRLEAIAGILFDFGLSSVQLNAPERGFSFLKDGPLDMRFNQQQPVTAARLLATAGVEKLTVILRTYGEERWAQRIAQAIVQRRAEQPLLRTHELADLVAAAVPRRFHPKHHHVATKVFQALRIAVNNELSGVERALRIAASALRPGGRLCVLSFQSLEDRIAKRELRQLAIGCICPPRQPVCTCNHTPQVKLLGARPVKPSDSEIEANPRARSARLRAAERLTP